MMGLRDTTRGEKLPEAYSPANRGAGPVTEFERMQLNEGRLVAAKRRSGRLFREIGPGKKV